MLTYKQQLAQQEAAGKAAMSARGVSAQSVTAGNEPPDFGGGGSQGILNPQIGGAIYVSGLGRLAPQEVMNELEAGRIREIFDANGRVKYVKNG